MVKKFKVITAISLRYILRHPCLTYEEELSVHQMACLEFIHQLEPTDGEAVLAGLLIKPVDFLRLLRHAYEFLKLQRWGFQCLSRVGVLDLPSAVTLML